MAKTSLLIFKKDCMGCHACEIACKQEHGLDVGPRLIRVTEKSADFIPTYCHHCAKAPCLESCPVQAIFKDEHGIVLIDNALCIGCKECIEACPFGAMQFDDQAEVAVKCDLCMDRLKNNEKPACAAACATQCIFWGDTKALHKKIQGSSIQY
jgi:Fe-S-cluster-containing dehydrogenase component